MTNRISQIKALLTMASVVSGSREGRNKLSWEGIAKIHKQKMQITLEGVCCKEKCTKMIVSET